LRGSIAVIVAVMLAAACAAAGCGGSEDPASWLERCVKAAEDYVREGGYLHFQQEAEFRLGTAGGEFEQVLRVEGDIIFPDREAYEYRETVSSTRQPGEAQENSFSYLTLDGGRTAYVRGERLSAQLGVAGWVRYTPPPGQNRYFDYLSLIRGLIAAGGEPEWLGYEDLEGVRCARVRYAMTGRELIDLRLREDPAFAQRYEGVDLEGIVGELQVEVWLREVDDLPVRVAIEQSVSVEEGSSTSNSLLFVFSGYGEEAPAPIEAPAIFRDAA
jgi:hypothetical protein